MAFGLTQAAVAEFAQKPFVRRALAQPFQPTSVLSFFLGLDYEDPTTPDALREGSFLEEASHFWYAGGEHYDELCQPFCPVIRSIGKQIYGSDEKVWQGTVDGKVSQLVLCDQLSRNCFRGTDEAFEFDNAAQDIACDLANRVLEEKPIEDDLEGEFYPCYATFVITALMHSEQLKNHETSLQMIDWAKDHTGPHLDKWWEDQRGYELEHKQVIDEFGRYPHRNGKLGRTNTPQEEKWLANVDDLPGWAKSQM